MQASICSRCGKNPAVVFITKIEGNQTKSEGLCLKCARELHIKPVDDILTKMGISDEDLDNLSGEMMNAMSGVEELMGMDPEETTENDEDGKTATFPFFGKLLDAFRPNGGASGAQQNPTDGEAGKRPGPGQQGPRPNPAANAKNGKRKYLDNYCIDLTARARAGELDAMVGRDEELERVIQILNRRQKNNPCLIGEPGVGKTAIAEGLAQRIAMGNVPYKLQNKQVFLLDLTSLVAGTQFRGQFESRMKGLIEEIRKQGNIILVIDEVHTIVGAGDAEGSMNAANILKPALSRGEIQVIGATTFAEYRKHIEKDSALERRFQPVTVNEPSIEDSIAILRGIAHYYEDYHSVEIPDEMCEKAVTMSERYITDRFLPDKAIDLLDEACSDVNLKDPDINRRMLVERELENIRFEADALLADNAHRNDTDTREQTEARYARIAELRSKELRLSQEQQELNAKGRPKLTVDNLARIIELWTKIPASSVKEDELERLAGLDARLKEHIIGQDEAVDAVCAAIRRGRVGLKVKRKPVSFIFVGGSGVGKTELVKRLAADMFDSPESLIRLDMSEFMEKFSVSRIIGSPPGYVGYDEAGQLTEKIRRKPYSVVLFDEIEKAHPDVMNILLQILDDGRITDAQGRTVNFENTIIIMTTNAGSNTKTASVGFGGTVSDMSRDRALKALGEFLRPEFLNRVDEVICFNSLTEENFAEIAVLMLNEVRDVMKTRDMTLTWDESVPAWLVKKGYSTVYGARNLRRLIQKEVEDKVAARIVEARGAKHSEIRLTADESGIHCEMSSALPDGSAATEQAE
ncbi:MAG: ATP-dependent Clp protease ATP-binding subunit [Oscillospiraceae bacterium]|nr:ATP-dependent Clp protease ATP-binding subunit [Oscillospiraceae bacterium]